MLLVLSAQLFEVENAEDTEDVDNVGERGGLDERFAALTWGKGVWRGGFGKYIWDGYEGEFVVGVLEGMYTWGYVTLT